MQSPAGKTVKRNKSKKVLLPNFLILACPRRSAEMRGQNEMRGLIDHSHHLVQ